MNRNFGKGQLYHILQNQIYIGKISHKGNIYNGEHNAIIDEKLFNLAQELLNQNTVDLGIEKSNSNSLLIGKLFDDKNNRMSPSHSRTRKKKYRYYVSQAITKFNKDKAGSISKLPADEIEKFVINEIKKYFSNTKDLQKYIANLSIQKQNKIIEKLKNTNLVNYRNIQNIIDKITVSKNWIEISLSKNQIQKFLYNLTDEIQDIAELKTTKEDFIIIKKDVRFSTTNSKGNKILIIDSDSREEIFINDNLVKAIVKSYYWHELLFNGKVKNTKEIQELEKMKDNSYIKQILNLRYLSPKIIESILKGTQPKDLTVSKLFDIKTLNWREQEQLISIN